MRGTPSAISRATNAANERRPVSAPDHVWLADELINATRPPRLPAEAAIPRREVIGLKVRKRAAAQLNNKLRHVGMVEITADQRELLAGIPPPLRDMRSGQPLPDPGQVVHGHRAEFVHRAPAD